MNILFIIFKSVKSISPSNNIGESQRKTRHLLLYVHFEKPSCNIPLEFSQDADLTRFSRFKKKVKVYIYIFTYLIIFRYCPK